MLSARKLFWSSDRGLTLLLSFLCLVVFVVFPLGNLHILGKLALSIFISLILISGTTAVAHDMLTTTLVGTVVIASLLVRWSVIMLGWTELEYLNIPLSFVSCVILAVLVTIRVFGKGAINVHRIQGAIAVYLLLGLIFAFAFEWLEMARPGAFTFTTSDLASDRSAHFVYFSLVALTTVGFGDITPVHPFARSLTSLEALIGQLYPAILLARLVSLELYYGTQPAEPKPGKDDPAN